MGKRSRFFRIRALPLLIAAGASFSCQPPRERTPQTPADEEKPAAEAAVADEPAGIERLLPPGTAVNGALPDGEGVLSWAIRNRHPELIRLALARGADVRQTAPDGTPLLVLALRQHRPELLAELLHHGADPNLRDAAGEAPVHVSLAAGRPEERRLLAGAGADFNLPDSSGVAPLEWALAERDLSLAEELAGYGARAGHEAWRQSLWRALARREAAALKACLRLGADPSARDEQGMLPLEWAVRNRQPALAVALLEAGARAGDALYHACRAGDRDLAALLLAGGVPPNPSRAPWLDTPLCAAVRAGDDELVAHLLAKGAHPFLRGGEGQSPLVLAVALRRHDVLPRLFARGADPNLPCVTPAQPDFLRHVRTRTMRWVLRNDHNVTPLMLAASTGDVRIARLLIAAGAKIDVTTRKIRYWPINFASSEQDVPMMRVLLGQDPHREERQIIVSLSAQRARVLGTQGEEIFSTAVSTGRTGFSTPPGVYVITSKHRDWKSTLYPAKMPFFQRLSCGDFGLHEGNVPGYPASHGCIRVPSGNAQKLYTLTKLGDRVRVEP